MLALPAAVALATAPNKGAVYFGDKGAISFQVSASGRSLSHFRGPYFSVPFCGTPATPHWQTHAKVKGGRFTIRMTLPSGKPLHSAHSKFGPVITGGFTGGGGVKGKLKDTEKCPSPKNPLGPSVVLKHRTASWSGSSEPQGKGSRYCFDHHHTYPHPTGYFTFSNVIEVDTTCKTVYAAMDAGTFSYNSTTHMTSFTTPGWTCTASARTYTCTQASARFSFQ
jgi:hypothetical protein